jgi:hypothetical protein
MVQRQSRPIALFVVPPSADKAYEEALEEELITAGNRRRIWRTAEGEMPSMPLR